MKTLSQSLALLTVFIPLVSSSQNDYFVKDSVTRTGISLSDGKEVVNHRVCGVREGGKMVEYTPWQVKEYGFRDGRIYLAKDIPLPDSTQRVFLEQLVYRKLYYYRGKEGKTFFMKEDSARFVELPEHHKGPDGSDISFRDDLSRLTSDCPQMADAVKLVRYNRTGYKKFMNRYEKCEHKPFPFLKFGVVAGYSTCKPVPKPSVSIPEVKQMEFSYDGGFSAGLFVDSPILLSDVSLFASLLFSQHEFSGNTMARNYVDVDFYGKMSSLQIPVLIRYSFPSNRIRPFINAGGVFSYNFKTESYLYQATIYNQVIEISDVTEMSLIQPVMIGYSIGGGAALQILPRNWLSVEVRYSGLFALQSAQALDISEIQITAGISF
jgi:hypothetical protein